MHIIMTILHDSHIGKPPIIADCYTDRYINHIGWDACLYMVEFIMTVVLSKTSYKALKYWYDSIRPLYSSGTRFLKQNAFIINIGNGVSGTLREMWPCLIEYPYEKEGLIHMNLRINRSIFFQDGATSIEDSECYISALIKTLDDNGHFGEIKSQIESLKLRGLL